MAVTYHLERILQYYCILNVKIIKYKLFMTQKPSLCQTELRLTLKLILFFRPEQLATPLHLTFIVCYVFLSLLNVNIFLKINPRPTCLFFICPDFLELHFKRYLALKYHKRTLDGQEK